MDKLNEVIESHDKQLLKSTLAECFKCWEISVDTPCY